jgi:hypothetical protein
VFALIFITTFSTTITLFNLGILRFFIFLSHFRQALAPRIDRWVQDGVFQLQRRAFDMHHEGQWTDLEKEIPVTEERDLLRELPVASLPLEQRRKSYVNEKRCVEWSENWPQSSEKKGSQNTGIVEVWERMDSELTLRKESAEVHSTDGVCE